MRVAWLVLVVAAGVLSSCAGGSPSAPSPSPTQAGPEVVVVRLGDKSFAPAVVVIHEGDTVVWENASKGGWHDIVGHDGWVGLGRLTPGQSARYTFEQAGVYSYYCTPHVIDGMQGTVVVLPKGAPLLDALPSPPALASASVPAHPVAYGSPDTITTVAGSGGVGGQATAASLYLPEGVAVDADNRVYVADTENCQVRRVDSDGTIVSVMGHESCGYSMGGDADLAPWLHTNHPRAVAVDAAGDVLVSDTFNCRVRKIGINGAVSTVAGSGSCRASGDGGPAAKAGLSPWGIVTDAAGNVYIADVFNCRVRKVDREGVISTVAGTGACAFTGDGGLATAAALSFPRGVAAAPDGTLYIADTGNCRVRRVQNGVIETVAGKGSCSYSGDGKRATAAGLHPWGIAVARGGSVLVADRDNCRVRRFTPGDVIRTIAGTGKCAASADGAASQTALAWPSGLALGTGSEVYIADTGSCRVRRIEADGRLRTVAGSGACAPGGDGGPAVAGGAWHPMGLAMVPGGEWYFSELDTCRVRHVDASGRVTTYAGDGLCGSRSTEDVGDGGPATSARLGQMLGGLALAADGSLYIADGYNCRVRRVDATGAISTVAGNGTCGQSGDGGPATDAMLGIVADVALDGAGQLYIAEPLDCRVRRVDLATGTIETAAGDGSCRFNGERVPARAAGIEPWGIGTGTDGTLYIADSVNCRVRQVDGSGSIVTLAGGDACGYAGDSGAATQAQLFRPHDVAVDGEGNVYVTDLRTFTVRKIDRAGIITTVAGVGVSRPIDIGGFDPTGGLLCTLHQLPIPAPAYLKDGGPASQAGLYFPYAIALDGEGHLYIADTFDHRVRRVTCGGSVPCAGQPPARASGRSTP